MARNKKLRTAWRELTYKEEDEIFKEHITGELRGTPSRNDLLRKYRIADGQLTFIIRKKNGRW